MLLKTALIVCAPLTVAAHPAFVAMVPNGANVSGFDAIGHIDPSGGGARNAFGQQFWDEWVNKFGWNSTFCCMDADNDGQSNGFELGDPCCVWKVGAVPAFTTEISHPGLPNSTTSRVAPACMTTACPKL